MLNKGVDAGTAIEILSIDIADVDVGKTIGAQLQTDQAEADKRIAQAKAEERRAMAVAKEQEMRAMVEEMRAKVVEAEAEVPRAFAQALREGKLGIVDYYNLQTSKPIHRCVMLLLNWVMEVARVIITRNKLGEVMVWKS